MDTPLTLDEIMKLRKRLHSSEAKDDGVFERLIHGCNYVDCLGRPSAIPHRNGYLNSTDADALLYPEPPQSKFEAVAGYILRVIVLGVSTAIPTSLILWLFGFWK